MEWNQLHLVCSSWLVCIKGWQKSPTLFWADFFDFQEVWNKDVFCLTHSSLLSYSINISIRILFIIQIFFWHILLSFSKCLFFSLLAFFYYPSYFSFIFTLLILRWNNKIFLACSVSTLKGEWNARKLDPSYSISISNQPSHHNPLIQLFPLYFFFISILLMSRPNKTNTFNLSKFHPEKGTEQGLNTPELVSHPAPFSSLTNIHIMTYWHNCLPLPQHQIEYIVLCIFVYF